MHSRWKIRASLKHGMTSVEIDLISIVFTSTYLHRISLLGQESHCFDQTHGTAPPTTDLQETHTYIETYSQWLSLQTHDNTYPVPHTLTPTMYPAVFRQFHGVNGNIPHMWQSRILERCWIILGRAWASNKLHLECPQTCSYPSSQTTMATRAWAKLHSQTMS